MPSPVRITAAHAHAGQPTGKLAEAAGREVYTERGGRHVGEAVGFVEHHEIVLGEHGSSRSQVGAVERVVHDEDVGIARPAPRVFGEAVVSVVALVRAGTLTGRTTRDSA